MSLNVHQTHSFDDPRDDFQKMRRTQLQTLLSFNNVEFNIQAPAVELRRIARKRGLDPNRDYPSPEQIYKRKVEAQHNDNPEWSEDETDDGIPDSSLIVEDLVSETPAATPQSGLQDFQPKEKDDEDSELIPYESMNFGKLKALAKEKGMALGPTTKKKEILEFLDGQNEDIA